MKTFLRSYYYIIRSVV